MKVKILKRLRRKYGIQKEMSDKGKWRYNVIDRFDINLFTGLPEHLGAFKTLEDAIKERRVRILTEVRAARKRVNVL